MVNSSVTQSFHLTKVSRNRKTGPIPVSTSSEITCPESCPLQKACYAKYGPLALHWDRVSSGDRWLSFDRFLSEIEALPRGQLWRHNEAGDLPGCGDLIDSEMLQALVDANRDKRGFTFTHKPVIGHPEHADAIRCANQNGFTVNLSANSTAEADELVSLDVGPVVTVLPEGTREAGKTPAGNWMIVCPNALDRRAKCLQCQLCQKADRKPIIGFPLHGTGKRHYHAEAA